MPPDLPDTPAPDHTGPDGILCLSHLRWERTLFQRPQQIMTEMARRRPVLYLANMATRDFARAVIRLDFGAVTGREGPNLRYVNVPYMPLTRLVPELGRLTRVLMALAGLLFIRLRRLRNIDLWIYHPGYTAFLDRFRRRRLVYDCMDLFREFKAASPREAAREKRLLEQADVVFTGGRSLQQAHAGINPRTWCYPSGVDFDHFGKAHEPETPVPDDIRDIPHPILGYFGALDERIDFELLEALCHHRRDASIVLIGPLVGIERVPFQAPNLRVLGRRPYDELPGYLKAFDVCLIPFALKELTRHMSPTKTPEYLAGGRPVVSTPVPDVVSDYGDLVFVGRSACEFGLCVDEALRTTDRDWRSEVLACESARTWSEIAREMEARVEESLQASENATPP